MNIEEKLLRELVQRVERLERQVADLVKPVAAPQAAPPVPAAEGDPQ